MEQKRQTVDFGLGKESLEFYLRHIGYWADDDLRRRNAYVLSPSAYVISTAQLNRLKRLSSCTWQAVKNLSGTLTQFANSKSIPNADARFLALATGHTRGLLHPKDAKGAVPPVLKIDLVQDAEGRYRIAEVDSYNARGFGFLAFLDGTLRNFVRDPYLFAGRGEGMPDLARLIRQAEVAEYGPWQLIVSEFERYYEPTFRILAGSLRSGDVDMRLVHESGGEDFKDGRMNVFCIPESMHRNSEGRDRLVQQWREGAVNVFYPPVAYLGSKAFLPYLRTQPGMDEFIPECGLVSKKSDPLACINGSQAVLKGVMSSGLKQVVFQSTEPVRFAAEYAVARAVKNPGWILQHEVPQEPTPVVVYEDEGTRVTRDYFLRITAYVGERGLLGAEVTGRTDRAVHGAPDCIQIPAVYIM